MSMPHHPQQFTLYRSKTSPVCQKVELALDQANAIYNVCEIDLFNKPEWYFNKVNPAGTVPAITYGGPGVPPEDPSPLGFKLRESAVILEFIADIYPEASLLPSDPVLRARARFLVDAAATKFFPVVFGFLNGIESHQTVLNIIDAIQALLPDSEEFAVGNTYTLADITIIPIIAQLRLVYENEVGKVSAEERNNLREALFEEKYMKYMRYACAMLERPNTRKVIDEEHVVSDWRRFFSQPH
ncbi:glutathione S-transferase C-terminal-like protein [Hygrophoropsis aurantiaca]|uniref:Glutathione S-transferase C-terminal-like protein n=1 Tax=Hygrophoropsis aurantiaca TaxID=72124 RepID=A0ACB8AH34_9AGAM|nr:glutathione S-transferase C-terminal-like protein [Hygrophoropsis aurantiaca]